jgi:hypothetical protein
MEIDPTKLLFIAVAALILLGPERLPEVARRAGEFWSQLKGHRDRLTQQIGSIPGIPGAAVSNFLSESLDPTRQLRGVIEQVRGPAVAPHAAKTFSAGVLTGQPSTRGGARVGKGPRAAADGPPEAARRGQPWLPSGFAPGSPDLN